MTHRLLDFCSLAWIASIAVTLFPSKQWHCLWTMEVSCYGKGVAGSHMQGALSSPAVFERSPPACNDICKHGDEHCSTNAQLWKISVCLRPQVFTSSPTLSTMVCSRTYEFVTSQVLTLRDCLQAQTARMWHPNFCQSALPHETCSTCCGRRVLCLTHQGRPSMSWPSLPSCPLLDLRPTKSRQLQSPAVSWHKLPNCNTGVAMPQSSRN